MEIKDVVLFIQVEIQWQNSHIGLPSVRNDCFVSGNPPGPDSIQDLTNTSDVIHYERLEPDTDKLRREITIKFSFTWTTPHVPFGEFLHYNMWLGPEILNDPNDNRELDGLEVGIKN